MSDRFPRSKKRGYDAKAVDAFLDNAKAQFLDANIRILDVKSIRGTRFELVKHGYSISAVDAAIEKLEDVFAERELARAKDEIGFASFLAEFTELKNLISSRVHRGKGKHFVRRIWPNTGYSVKQVDQLCSRVGKFLDGTAELAVRDARMAVFHSRRGGYAEHQVDAFIDKLVELLQRQKVLASSAPSPITPGQSNS